MSQFLSSNELFINIKNPPQWNPRKSYYEQDIDVLDFYLEEKRKITEGITIGGYYIHPWLYWHLNFFKTNVPVGKGSDAIMNQPLDDNFLYVIESYQEAEEKNLALGLFGTRGFGKALRNDEPLLYEEGWKPIGDAKVGDKIYGADGKLTTIKGVYPQGEVDLYKVTLRDGREVISCDEHLWHVYDFQAKLYKTLPLKELIRRYKYDRKYTGNKYKDGKQRISEVYNYYIPANDCMEFKEKNLPLDPYFLGLWIGDGTSRSPEVTTIDEEILNYITLIATENNLEVKQNKPLSYYLSSGAGKGKKHGRNEILNQLNSLNLKGNKHIPDIYLKSSQKQRLDLLRGLMDSDGTVSKTCGQISFSQSNYNLILQVRELVLSLGISCSLNEIKTNYMLKNGEEALSWSLVLYTDEEVFNLTRKKNRIVKTHKNNKFNRSHTSIVNIEKIESGEATCIRVDNEDKLFVTRNYVVTHNSVDLSSLISWTNTIKPTGVTSVYGGEEKDLKEISQKLQIGFNNVHPALYIPQIISNWDSEIVLGLKEKDGFKLPYSYINIINAAGGSKKKSEKGAGGSPSGLILDEIGKYAFLGIWEAALPSFFNAYGARLVPVLCGTSGNKEVSKDAKDVFENPEAYSILPMNWDRLDRTVPEEFHTWKGSRKEKFCTFVPGQMTYRNTKIIKLESNLADYLCIDDPKLSEIKVNVTDWATATKIIKDKINAHTKIESQEKERMYFPLDLSDVFITESANPFPTAVIERHIRKLEDEGRTGKDIDIFKDTMGKNKAEFVQKKRSAVSHGGGESDAPIVLFQELPETPPARHIFVSGLDDYKLELSDTDSLGALYIIKRRNLEPNQPCETIAASYVARPYNHRDLHNTCEKMIEVWDAECNMESADISFIQHLDLKGKTMKLLVPAFSFQEAISKSPSKLNSRYGIYPTPANKSYMFNLLIDFCKEEHVIDIDDEGNQIIKYGVEFLEDIDLLKEMMRYKKGGNFDRITAFMHALAYARELDKKGIAPIDRRHDQLRKDQMKGKPKTTRTIFSSNSNRRLF